MLHTTGQGKQGDSSGIPAVLQSHCRGHVRGRPGLRSRGTGGTQGSRWAQWGTHEREAGAKARGEVVHAEIRMFCVLVCRAVWDMVWSCTCLTTQAWCPREHSGCLVITCLSLGSPAGVTPCRCVLTDLWEVAVLFACKSTRESPVSFICAVAVHLVGWGGIHDAQLPQHGRADEEDGGGACQAGRKSEYVGLQADFWAGSACRVSHRL